MFARHGGFDERFSIMMIRLHRMATTLAVGLAAFLLIAPATAESRVPQKDYACYGATNTYIGTLKITSRSTYKYFGKGRYRSLAHGGIRFRTGSLRKWVGRVDRSGSSPSIILATRQGGGLTVNCYS